MPPRLSNYIERIKDEWNAFAAIQGICIADMKMKMWAGRVTGISKQPDDLTFTNPVADFHANAARLQVSIEGIAVLAQVNTYPIAGYRFASDWRRRLKLSRCLRNILRDAVLNEGNNTIGDGEDLSAIAVKHLVCDVIWKGTGQDVAGRINFIKINSETLGVPDLALADSQILMNRIVCRTITASPGPAAQRCTYHNGLVVADRNLEIIQHQVAVFIWRRIAEQFNERIGLESQAMFQRERNCGRCVNCQPKEKYACPSTRNLARIHLIRNL